MRTIASTLGGGERMLAAISGADARIEAEVLLAHALGADRAHLLARLADTLDDATSSAFDGALCRRLAREPLAYIVEHCEFYGVCIECTPAALIPRWETEMLVEMPLERAREHGRLIRVADVGTGTGAIAIAVAANARNVAVTATDASGDALALARRNVDRHCVADRVTLVHTDQLDGLGEFDVIVANLPYVSEREWPALEPEIRDHEPRDALVGGPTGLEIVEQLLRHAPGHLAVGGVLAAEIGAGQGAAAQRIAHEHFPEASICVTKDLAGHDRVLEVRT